MNEQTKHNLTVKIADVEPFKLKVAETEEAFYRHIIEKLNRIWAKMHYGAVGESSQVALAKTALYYAEMFYRKSALANEQSRQLENFEQELDKLLRDLG